MRTQVYRSPWYNLDGYIACQLKFDDGSRRTILQHREIMEAYLGRKLDYNEVVHHKDGNKSNNELENLEVMSRADHTREHNGEPELLVFECPECGTEFDRLARYHRKNQVKKKAEGPFCGRSCAGRFNQKKRAA